MVTRHDRGSKSRPADAPTVIDRRAEDATDVGLEIPGHATDVGLETAGDATDVGLEAADVEVTHDPRPDGAANRRSPSTGPAPTRPRIAKEAAAAHVRRWRPRLPAVTRLAAYLGGPSGAQAETLLRQDAGAFTDAAAGALDTPVQIEALNLSTGSAAIAGFAVPVAIGDEIVAVRACPGLVAALVEALTGSPTPPLAERPDPVTAAVLGHGALLLCDALHETGLAAPRILTGISPRTAVSLELRVRVGARLGQLQLGFSEAFARRLVEARHERATAAASGALASARDAGSSAASTPLADLRQPVDVCMGPVRLTADTVAALRPGDALCPDPDARLSEGRPRSRVFLRSARLAAATPVATAVLEGGRVAVEGLVYPTPTFTEVPVSAPATPPESLPVDVHLVLATLPLTLAELATLGPGSVLEVAKTLPRVRVQVGDRCIATGELVDVDGVLGLRILETEGSR